MRFLRERINDPEIMDDFSIQDERIGEALAELKVINKFLGGISTTKKGLRKFLRNTYDKKIKILDAGSGASDVFEKEKNKFVLFSLDRNKKICTYLKSNKNINPVFGNALELPFKRKSFDIVHTSLFLHHLNEEEIKKLLSVFSETAVNGIIINDLRRSILAYLGIKILTMLFSKSDFVKNDGPLSVKKGFTKDDLTKILNKIPFSRYEIKRTWAFRWLVVIYLN